MEIDSGVHAIIEMSGVDEKLLWDYDFVRNAMLHGAEASGAHILHDYFHHFGDQYGITGVVAVSESHLSIHTWPEWNYAAVDVFLCRGMDPRIAANHIINTFGCIDFDIKIVTRKANVSKEIALAEGIAII